MVSIPHCHIQDVVPRTTPVKGNSPDPGHHMEGCQSSSVCFVLAIMFADRQAYMQVFVPSKDESEVLVALQRFGILRAITLLVQSLLGWPLYLFFNASGREYSRFANHFDPTSPIYSKRERPGVSKCIRCSLCCSDHQSQSPSSAAELIRLVSFVLSVNMFTVNDVPGCFII